MSRVFIQPVGLVFATAVLLGGCNSSGSAGSGMQQSASNGAENQNGQTGSAAITNVSFHVKDMGKRLGLL